jgi:TolB-like protein
MRNALIVLALAGVLVAGGCGGPGTTVFVHPEFDFSYVESIAVVPFENLSDDQGAGARASRYFTASLLASEAFEIVEPGEVTRALESLAMLRTAELTTQQIQSLGRELRVQGLFLGTVSESAAVRSGSTTVNTVTVVIRLVETETGVTVWSATNTEDSSTFWSSLFGTKQRPLSEVTRRCIDKTLDTLFN